MRWFWKRRKPKLPKLKDHPIKEDKILDRMDKGRLKGGRKQKSRIWNGCGGHIPQ